MTTEPEAIPADVRELARRLADENELSLFNEDMNAHATMTDRASRAPDIGGEVAWRDGAPQKPWADEWFIAETTYGDRVVLRSLPEDYTYDFKTADETYIKADKIRRWMQFPDSQFIAPGSSHPAPASPDAEMVRDELEAAITKFAGAAKRNALEMASMPLSVVEQHFREFSDEIGALLSKHESDQS